MYARGKTICRHSNIFATASRVRYYDGRRTSGLLTLHDAIRGSQNARALGVRTEMLDFRHRDGSRRLKSRASITPR